MSAVIAEYHARRVIVGGAIVLIHALALYGLATRVPPLQSVPESRLLALRFIDEPPPALKWRPPDVITVPAVIAQIPDVPFIEIPATPNSQQPIVASLTFPAADHSHPEIQSVPRLISSVEYLREPAPRYPPQSRKLREQGLVILRVLIDERGAAAHVEVASSSGFARLDQAACEAVGRAAFLPYVEDGTPRRALVLIPVEFSLGRGALQT